MSKVHGIEMDIAKDERGRGSVSYIKVPYGTGCTKIKDETLREISKVEERNYLSVEWAILQTSKIDFEFIPFNDCDPILFK